MKNAIANGKSFFKQKKCGVPSLLGLEMKSISGLKLFDLGHQVNARIQNESLELLELRSTCWKSPQKLTVGTEYFLPFNELQQISLSSRFVTHK